MPRLIDYSTRFELIREAVVRIAARSGGSAVTLDVRCHRDAHVRLDLAAHAALA